MERDEHNTSQNPRSSTPLEPSRGYSWTPRIIESVVLVHAQFVENRKNNKPLGLQTPRPDPGSHINVLNTSLRAPNHLLGRCWGGCQGGLV